MTKKTNPVTDYSLLFTDHRLLIIGIATAVLFTLLLYWPTLRLPVIYDDLLHIRIAKGLNFANVWLPTEAFGFYRPFTFVPLLVIKGLFGYYPHWLLHGLNIGQHALNVVLLIILSWRLWPSAKRAVATGLLFAVFPFSYQAIAVYGHNVHPTITNLMLIGLHLYLSREGNHRTRYATRFASLFTWLIFIIALLTHESAVLFGFLAGMVQWCGDGRFPPIRHLFDPRRSSWLWYIIVGTGYLILYQFLPISRAPQAVADGGAVMGKVLYLLQTAAYPLVAGFSRWLPNLNAHTVVLFSFGLALLLTAWAAQQRHNWLPLLLGWGWWALASALIAIPLPTNYLVHGPRLLYLGSVGLTLFWPILVEFEEPKSSEEKGKRFGLPSVLFLFLVATLLTNWTFVRGRLADYGRLTSAVDVVKSGPIALGEGVVIVNLPQWLAPPHNTYPAGVELAAMMGDYLFAEELISENSRPGTAVYPLIVPELLTQTEYHYGLHDESNIRRDGIGQIPLAADWTTQGSQVFVVRYLAEGPTAVHTGSLRPATHDQPIAHFPPYNLFTAQANDCDGRVTAQLVWAEARYVPATTSIFVQALSADGRLLAQADGPPLDLPPAYLQLQPGWHIIDQRQLSVPDGEQPAQLLIGVYDYITGQRTLATTAANDPLPDHALAIPITACSTP